VGCTIDSGRCICACVNFSYIVLKEDMRETLLPIASHGFTHIFVWHNHLEHVGMFSPFRYQNKTKCFPCLYLLFLCNYRQEK